MHPIFFSFGPIHLYAYGTFVAFGIFFAISFLRKTSEQISVSSEAIVDLAIATVVSGFLGARLFTWSNFGIIFKKHR